MIRKTTALLGSSLLLIVSAEASAAIVDVEVGGGDAIFLAGRTDLVIPDASLPWNTGTHLIRHGGATPEEIKETVPNSISVTGGDVIRALDPAIGGISFYNGFISDGAVAFGPGGNGVSGSNLNSLDGISGYKGPQGPLVGVFLDDNIPDGTTAAPATLDFTGAGLGINFASLAPALSQVFYIGDGLTSGGLFQEFTAPAGATRLFLGIPDGFSFVGAPGAYDDNDGSYSVRIGINEVPSLPPVPLPGALWLMLTGIAGFIGLNRRKARI